MRIDILKTLRKAKTIIETLITIITVLRGGSDDKATRLQSSYTQRSQSKGRRLKR